MIEILNNIKQVMNNISWQSPSFVSYDEILHLWLRYSLHQIILWFGATHAAADGTTAPTMAWMTDIGTSKLPHVNHSFSTRA